MRLQSHHLELLSPARDAAIAREAILHGADAVYIGGPGFGARHNASNSLSDIAELVPFAHRYGAKVFVTLNTILHDDELEPAQRLITDLYETGVDAHNSMTFYYQNGVMATAQSSILCHSDRMGAVWGTEGYLTCQNINNVEAIDVFDGSHAVTAHYDVPEQLTGYEYEVASAAQAMLDGRTECDEMPHSDTLRIMECMDSLRADWGLKYPFEA